MFTGIIETLGRIDKVEKLDGNLSLWISSTFVSDLKIDQSIAHNGICLTIDKMENNLYRVTAIEETITKTAISDYKIGDIINLERCLLLSQRLDGHIVQGHVDTVGVIQSIEIYEGSHEYTIEYDRQFAELVIEKGSIAIDGISLTCHSVQANCLKVSIIPYTYEHTKAKKWTINDRVNIEFDILGKYIQRRLELNKNQN